MDSPLNPEAPLQPPETEQPASPKSASRKRAPTPSEPAPETKGGSRARAAKSKTARAATPGDVPMPNDPASTSGLGQDVPSYEETARRAYELYLGRGGGPGRHEEDWYRAEDELRRRRAGGRTTDADEAPPARAGEEV